MDNSRVDSEIAALLSRITEQQLQPQNITPLLVFIVALVSILRGVIVIDRTIATEEEQRLEKTINSFIPPDSNVYPLIQLILKGVEQHQVYLNPNDLLILASPLSDSEKLLIMGLGYEMSAADGSIDFREQMYLQSIGNRLKINARHLKVLEAQFTHPASLVMEDWEEVQVLLDPVWFEPLDPVFVTVAMNLLSVLAAKS